jgi:hypothetical protein
MAPKGAAAPTAAIREICPVFEWHTTTQPLAAKTTSERAAHTDSMVLWQKGMPLASTRAGCAAVAESGIPILDRRQLTHDLHSTTHGMTRNQSRLSTARSMYTLCWLRQVTLSAPSSSTNRSTQEQGTLSTAAVRPPAMTSPFQAIYHSHNVTYMQSLSK